MNDLIEEALIHVRPARALENARVAERNLEELYDHYAGPLYRFALALLGTPEDAEDAVQEVFVRIARGSSRIERVANLKCYLFTATRNAAYGLLRRKRSRDRLVETICAELATTLPAQDQEPALYRDVLCRAFAELPIEQREVVVLKVFDQMTFAEVARTLGTSLNTVASRYRYGIEKLRKALEVSDDGQ